MVRDAGGVQDWYVTCIEGIAGGTIPPLPSGVRTTDGHNLWPALLGENLTSPRTEVIRAVHNQYAPVPSPSADKIRVRRFLSARGVLSNGADGQVLQRKCRKLANYCRTLRQLEGHRGEKL